MALGFSSGLLTGLQTFGQGGGAIPADPRQRNAMQAAGVTNPLLQRFGQGLGGMLGNDMRSPMEQFGSAIQGIDTSTPEGKKALIAALAKVDPVSAVKMNEAFKQEQANAPLKAAELALKQAQATEAERKANERTTATILQVPLRDALGNPIEGAFDLKQFYVTQVYNPETKEWSVAEQSADNLTKLGIDPTQVATPEIQDRHILVDPTNPMRTIVIEYRENEDGEVVPYRVVNDKEAVEVTEEYVNSILEANNQKTRQNAERLQQQQQQSNTGMKAAMRSGLM